MALSYISISYVCLLVALAIFTQSSPATSALLVPSPSTKPLSLSNNNHLLLPNLPTNHTAQNLTTLNHTLTTANASNFLPQCWRSVPQSEKPALLIPIEDPPDCYETILHVVGRADPDAPAIWIQPQAWHYESCSIFLVPVSTRALVVRDTFTRGDITRQALALQILCVTEGMGWLGGRMKVGRGVFEVYLMDGLLGRAREGVERHKRGSVDGLDRGGESYVDSVAVER